MWSNRRQPPPRAWPTGGMPPPRIDQQIDPPQVAIGPQASNGAFARVFVGNDFEINSSGAFFYSPSKGAGNLVASITNGTGTDAAWGGGGNTYLAGETSYYAGSPDFIAIQNWAGAVNFYKATTEAGPWVLQGFVAVSNATTDMQVSAFAGSGNVVLTAGGAGNAVEAIYGDGTTYDTGRVTVVNTGQTIAVTGDVTIMSHAVGVGSYRYEAWIIYHGGLAAGTPVIGLALPTNTFAEASVSWFPNGTAAPTTGGLGTAADNTGPTYQTSEQYVLVKGIVTTSAVGSITIKGHTSSTSDHWIIDGGTLDIFPVVAT